MIDRKPFVLAMLAALSVACAAAAPSPSSAMKPLVGDGTNLVFAVSYDAAQDGQTDSYLELGYFTFYGPDTLRMNYLYFDAGADLPAWVVNAPLKLYPPMNAPYGGDCTPDPIHVPAYGAFQSFSGKYKLNGDALTIQIGEVVYDWRLDLKNRSGFKLASGLHDSSGSVKIGGTTFGQAHGFAFVTEDLTGSAIALKDLAPHYDGELFQKNAAANSDWTRLTESLDASVFEVRGDPDTPTTSFACPVSYAPKMWCQSTLLLNYAPLSKLIVYLSGGHDYNQDGCFNDAGHMIQMWGAREGGAVTKLVFVEYSWQASGSPILSVGRYYRP